jgi:hypothetical protein
MHGLRTHASFLAAAVAAAALLLAACGGPIDEEPGDGNGELPEDRPALATGEVSLGIVYEAVYASGPMLPASREWLPWDLSVSPKGDLWVVQRMPRHPDFDDTTECPSTAGGGTPHDCGGLQGSTVSIQNPASAEPASEENGRARLVVDANSWHFMRRPSGIAFGAEEIWIDPEDPGAYDPDSGQPVIDEPTAYTDTFATCSEHFTGNYTDAPAYNGPSLWSGDPAIYTGFNGPYSWSNGSHLDMLHGTGYCMGIAWDEENRYWLFNGELGTLDHYDFVAPHVPGHYYHGDAVVTRIDFGADPLARRVDVPSNMATLGGGLYIADSGNARVVRFDTEATGTVIDSFSTADPIAGDVIGGIPLESVLSAGDLAEAWGADPAPSGLAVLDEGHLVIGDATSGKISVVTLEGEILRTLDLGLGGGLGGLTVIDGTVYLAHGVLRRVYRLDVAE